MNANELIAAINEAREGLVPVDVLIEDQDGDVLQATGAEWDDELQAVVIRTGTIR